MKGRWAIIPVAALVAVVALRTARLRSRQLPPPPPTALDVDPEAAARRLSEAIRRPTPTGAPMETFAEFHRFLRESFPAAGRELSWEAVGGGSLLLTWPGADPRLEPAALLGHLDVVPAEAATLARWSHPPFAGHRDETWIWGRGAIDDKGSVMAMLEAVEGLLRQGFRPRRTLFFAFGNDEEGGGSGGAAKIAALLAARGLRLESALDEGSILAVDLVPGLAGEVALVGTAEKGHLSLSLTAECEGGHASIPAHPTAIERLVSALERLRRHPMPARLDGPARAMFEALAPDFPPLPRAVLANLWLTGPLLLHRLEAAPSTDALVRTTLVPTVLAAGSEDNVVPGSARAVLNLRLRPGDSVASALEHVRRVVGDPSLRIEVLPGSAWEPSPVGDPSSPAFLALSQALREAYPRARVAPTLVLAATDSRHYLGLARSVFRFAPLRMGPSDLARFHGVDERVAQADHADAIRFFAAYLRRH